MKQDFMDNEENLELLKIDSVVILFPLGLNRGQKIFRKFLAQMKFLMYWKN